MNVKDHSVSGENFSLVYDEKLHMYHTSPKPTPEKLPSYYLSEDYISHTDGKRSLFEKCYQLVKGITLSRKQKLLKTYLPNKGSILDIGTGTGDFPAYMMNRGWTTQAIEPNEQARNLAALKGVEMTATLDEVSDVFDGITMWHVLEHVYDLDQQITWLKKHLKEGGFLFVAVPNFESLDASYYKEYWAAYDVPRHLYHFSQKAIRGLFGEHDLDVVKVHPMTFDAYYVSLLSEKYKTGKMNFGKAFLKAWQSNKAARKTGNYSSLIYVLKHKGK